MCGILDIGDTEVTKIRQTDFRLFCEIKVRTSESHLFFKFSRKKSDYYFKFGPILSIHSFWVIWGVGGKYNF